MKVKLVLLSAIPINRLLTIRMNDYPDQDRTRNCAQRDLHQELRLSPPTKTTYLHSILLLVSVSLSFLLQLYWLISLYLFVLGPPSLSLGLPLTSFVLNTLFIGLLLADT